MTKFHGRPWVIRAAIAFGVGFSVGLSAGNDIHSLHPQIPSLEHFIPSSARPFTVSGTIQIIVDSDFATQSDSNDAYSPSLLQYATTFREDLLSLTGFSNIPPILLGTLPFANAANPVVFLSLGATNKTNYNGKHSLEGYDLDISSTTFIIRGVGAVGAWWGTRTFLQQITIGKHDEGTSFISIPAGSGFDVPGWAVRGFMLDAGRHWFEASFISDLCIYASFFKLNELHLHASDNLWNPAFLYNAGDSWRDLYAAFRFRPSLLSNIVGLVPRRNESWSSEDFRDMQSTCLMHGVNIVPEIDTPGHSLVITRWKPELMLAGNPDQLNLSYPETTPTIQEIWDEFLPWFVSQEVHIGADEYDTDYADDYISFVNTMSSYLSRTTSPAKSTRIWGTSEPSNTSAISTNITIQHWDFPSTIPTSLMSQGYSVINSEQAFLYLDGKTSENNQFPQSLNETLMWSGAPDGTGWAPNIFSSFDASNNTSPNAPLLRGSVMALWNDWGNNATTPLEIYYQLARSLAVLAEKTWAGSGVRDSALSREQFEHIYPALNAAAPGQNLNRNSPTIPTDGVVFEYAEVGLPGQYTGVASVGPPYTFSFTIGASHLGHRGVLFTGKDSILHLLDASLAFEDPTTNILYSLANFTTLDGVDTPVIIHATREYTCAFVDGDLFFFTTLLDIWGDYLAVANVVRCSQQLHRW